ncbi:MFS transporter [Actinopolymorpha singaporensis]|nr:MFS transporter [Actinopolymorpha singaporensis]
MFLGLIIGALMDRWRRQRALMITSVVRAVALASVPVLLLTDALDFWSLATVVLVLGVLTLFGDSAAQPFLPRIVPRNSLVMANARLGQSETVARTVGPALGGALLNLVGAPILFVFEGAINAIAAVLQSRIRVDEPRPEPRPHGRHTGHDIADGMRYTYQHRTLRPPAISVHTWFLANSIVSTVFAVFVLRELDMPAWGYGVALAWVLLGVRCALRPTTLSGLAGLAGHRSIGRGSTADLQVRIEAAAPRTAPISRR